MKEMLSIISKNNFKGNYMLYCPVTAIPPYFGTLTECRKSQAVFEKRLHKDFDVLTENEKCEIRSQIEFYRKRNGDFSA